MTTVGVCSTKHSLKIILWYFDKHMQFQKCWLILIAGILLELLLFSWNFPLAKPVLFKQLEANDNLFKHCVSILPVVCYMSQEVTLEVQVPLMVHPDNGHYFLSCMDRGKLVCPSTQTNHNILLFNKDFGCSELSSSQQNDKYQCLFILTESG